MGPYSENKQIERAERVKSLLARSDLSEWARNFWEGVARNLPRNEWDYNHRLLNAFGKDFRPLPTITGA